MKPNGDFKLKIGIQVNFTHNIHLNDRKFIEDKENLDDNVLILHYSLFVLNFDLEIYILI